MLDVNDPVRGAALRRRREAAMKTQAVTAKASGVGLATLKRAEAGDPLRAETASSLCAVLGIPPGAFVPPDWGAPPMETLPSPACVPTGPATPAPPPPAKMGRSPRDLLRAVRRRIPLPFCSAVTVPAAILVEASSWIPWEHRVDLFWFLQFLVQLLLVSGLQADVLGRLLDACSRGAPLLRPALAMLGAVALSVGFLGKTKSDIDATAARQVDDLRRYLAWKEVVVVRSILDPAWDPLEARWAVDRWMMRREGVRPADLDSPGAMAAAHSLALECRRAFLTSPSYDHASCDPPPFRRVDDEPLLTLASSIVGGDLAPHDDGDPYGEAADPAHVLAPPAFDAAKRLVASATLPTGWVDVPAALAAAREAAAHTAMR